MALADIRPLKEGVRLRTVLVGRAKPLGASGVLTAIVKTPVAGSVSLDGSGLVGDEQADSKHHGGPDKLVHHYPFEHYTYWADLLTDSHCDWGLPGAFGENLSTLGLTERTVCVGDIFRIGSAVLQVSQGRQPCWKLNLRFGVRNMALRVQKSGLTGWYYRVVEPGEVRAGNIMKLLDRPFPDWNLERLIRCMYLDPLDYPSLTEMAKLPPLSDSWRRIASRRLMCQRVEPWDGRLLGS